MTIRTALVSGGTGALGSAICQALLAQGHRVVALGHPSEAARLPAWEAAHRVADDPARLSAVLADVTDYAAMQSVCAEIGERHGPITILVNGAGITRDAPLRKLEPEDWRAVIATNLDSVYNLSRACLDGMLAAGFGRIVNIASVNGRRGQFGQTNYAAAKAGMHGFTMALAQETARKGITVNTLSPGYIDSPMIQKVPAPIREQIVAGIPVGRFGQPADIARAVAFLTAAEAGYITGSELAVNGGMHMY